MSDDDEVWSSGGGRTVGVLLIAGMLSPVIGGVADAVFGSAWWAAVGIVGGLVAFGGATVFVARRRERRTIEVLKQIFVADRPPPSNALERVAVKPAAPILASIAWGIVIAVSASGQGGDRITHAVWTAGFTGLAVLLVRPRRTRALDEPAEVAVLLLVASAAVLDGFRLLNPAIFPGGARDWAFLFAGWLGFAVAYDLRRPPKTPQGVGAVASVPHRGNAWLTASLVLVVVGFVAGLVLSFVG